MIAIQFHNTLSGKKEIFTPLEPGKIKMYVCGVTPYDAVHLGHARCYSFFDTVRRFFLFAGYQVHYVQNFTDIDDKIIAKAAKVGGEARAVAEEFIQDYFLRMNALNILPADKYPRVTEHVPDIVAFIENLIAKGAAYEASGDVFYSVRQMPHYGALSKRNLDDLRAGARVEVNEQKADPLDFALWKKAKPNEPSWTSPWGQGRPGWHIECSVMSIKHLGETFDLHGGGQDLIFPHHENEIAQSEAATKKTFARYWLHNGFVTVNREKMSKSLGNFFTLGEIFAQVPPQVVRFFLLSRHYRSPLDFSDDVLRQAESAWKTLWETDQIARALLDGQNISGAALQSVAEEFTAALADDLNTEKAIAVLFGLRAQMLEKIKARDLAALASARHTLKTLLTDVLGVELPDAWTSDQIRSMKARLIERAEYRKNKDWAKSDQVRDELLRLGAAIEDTPQGAILKPS